MFKTFKLAYTPPPNSTLKDFSLKALKIINQISFFPANNLIFIKSNINSPPRKLKHSIPI